MTLGYIKARSIDEALKSLNEHKPNSRVLAGGTDIITKTRNMRLLPTNEMVLVDIKGIAELHGISLADNQLLIGSNTTLNELMENKLVQSAAPVLVKAAGQVGSAELRNRATVGGNICTKNPSADLLIPLLGMDAEIQIQDCDGQAKMSMDALLARGLKGFGRRSLITSIRIPVRPSMIYGYRRWSRESMGRSYLTIMTTLELNDAVSNCQLTVVAGGANLWPRSVRTIVPFEMILKPTERRLLADQLISNNLGFSAENNYRFYLAKALLYEVLEEAVEEVQL